MTTPQSTKAKAAAKAGKPEAKGVAPATAGVTQTPAPVATPAPAPAPAPVAETKPADPHKAHAIRVVAKVESFRRAGRQFGREPVVIALSDLQEHELELLRGEPMLAVALVREGE